MEHNCVICGKPAEATICEACARDWARRLAWLLKAGMPALQQIAYKQATTRERSPRHGNTAYAAPPVNETAQALFNAVEVHLQLMGGRLGIKPLGYDRYERARTLMQWADLIRLLLRRMRDLARLEDASGLYADTLRLAERVDAATSHSAEKRLETHGMRYAPHAAHGSTCGAPGSNTCAARASCTSPAPNPTPPVGSGPTPAST